jgi:hypothetical protein
MFQTLNYFIESAMNVPVDCRDDCRDASLAHSLIMRILVGPHRSAGLCVPQVEYESYASNQTFPVHLAKVLQPSSQEIVSTSVAAQHRNMLEATGIV